MGPITEALRVDLTAIRGIHSVVKTEQTWLLDPDGRAVLPAQAASLVFRGKDHAAQHSTFHRHSKDQAGAPFATRRGRP